MEEDEDEGENIIKDKVNIVVKFGIELAWYLIFCFVYAIVTRFRLV